MDHVFDLFPQHCLLPQFTPDQHAEEVHNELFESVQVMSKPAKKKLLQTMRKALDILATEEPIQRVEPLQRSEGASQKPELTVFGSFLRSR